MTNAEHADGLLEMERHYREEAILARGALEEGSIVEEEYQEFEERHKLALGAVQEWQKAWLACLERERRKRIVAVTYGFTRREVIERLVEFREEFGEFFLSADAPVALVLRDVANLLGLDEEDELPQVLGAEVAEAIRAWEHSRLWRSRNGRVIAKAAEPVKEPSTASA